MPNAQNPARDDASTSCSNIYTTLVRLEDRFTRCRQRAFVQRHRIVGQPYRF